jgi:hypothetical protein
MARKIVIGVVAVLVIVVAIGYWRDWSGFHSRKRQACVRCGTVREVEWRLGLEAIGFNESIAGNGWFDRHAGPCSEHRWRHSGSNNDELSEGTFGITPSDHALIAALASLNDADSIAMVKSFAALSEQKQAALWSTANQAVRPTSVAGQERAVIDAVISSAEWPASLPAPSAPR